MTEGRSRWPLRPVAAVALGGAALWVAGGVSVAAAGDGALIRAHDGAYRAAELAAGSIGPPAPTQRAYDAARNLQVELGRLAPVTGGCADLLRALAVYGAARVRQAEGIDRLSAGEVTIGRRRAERARIEVARARRACRPRSGPRGLAARPLAISPTDGEAFFGAVVAQAPRGATAATLRVGGRSWGPAPVRGGRVRFTVDLAPGRHDLRVVFAGPGAAAGAATARGTWLLPASAPVAASARADRSLQDRLERALATGPRHRAAMVWDLSSGRRAAVNVRARFPAASTVKLGLMAGVLARLGPRPQDSPHSHDLRAIAAWSSNLAANRLLARFGSAAARDGLRRLGARASTYTGEYLVGTEAGAVAFGANAAQGPPLSSARVTTAQDLATMLATVYAASSGSRPDSRALGQRHARLLLGWLLASEQRGENSGLFAGPAGRLPIAQKNGWLRSARHGAAIIFTARGPVITVLLTQDDAGVSPATARAVGGRVARVALSAR